MKRILVVGLVAFSLMMGAFGLPQSFGGTINNVETKSR